jgi:hypothetical protein
MDGLNETASRGVYIHIWELEAFIISVFALISFTLKRLMPCDMTPSIEMEKQLV